MTSELMNLTWVLTLSAVMWVPYILNTIMVRGLTDAVGYPENPKPLAPWAERMKKAHYNAVENLVLFAALVLVAHLTNATNDATAAAAITYFWARLAHYILYTAGIPFTRTLTFTIGWLALICIFYQIVT